MIYFTAMFFNAYRIALNILTLNTLQTVNARSKCKYIKNGYNSNSWSALLCKYRLEYERASLSGKQTAIGFLKDRALICFLVLV